MIFDNFCEYKIKNNYKINEIKQHSEEDIKINFSTTTACIKKLKVLGGKINHIEEKYYYSTFDIKSGVNKEIKGAKIGLLSINEPTINYNDLMLIPLDFIIKTEETEFFDDLGIPKEKYSKMELIGDILRVLPTLELRLKIVTEYNYDDFIFEADLKEDITIISNAKPTTTSFRINGKDLEPDSNIIQKIKPSFSSTINFVETYKMLF